MGFFDLFEQVHKFLKNKSLVDYGLLISIAAIIPLVGFFKNIDEITSIELFVIGSLIAIIGEMRDSSKIEFACNNPISFSKHEEKPELNKPHFRNLNQVKIVFPSEPISIDIIFRNKKNPKIDILSFFQEHFDFYIDLSYHMDLISVSSTNFEKKTGFDNKSRIQQRIKLTPNIDRETVTKSITISVKKVEDAYPLKFSIGRVCKNGIWYQKYPLLFLAGIFISSSKALIEITR